MIRAEPIGGAAEPKSGMRGQLTPFSITKTLINKVLVILYFN